MSKVFGMVEAIALFVAGVMTAMISSRLKKPSKIDVPSNVDDQTKAKYQAAADDIDKSRKYATFTSIGCFVLAIVLGFMILIVP